MKRIIINNVESSLIIDKDVDFVVAALNEGKVIAFPTDTVYGLGCVYDNQKAIEKIKDIKGRSESKPLPMMVADYKQLNGIAQLDENAIKLFQTLTPGALTLILNKDEKLPAFVNNGFNTIAIRIPNDAFILSVIKKLNKPMLVTSANRSDYPTGTSMEEVFEQIPNEIDYVVEGACVSKVSSTIIDLTKELKLIREGEIKLETIMEVIK